MSSTHRVDTAAGSVCHTSVIHTHIKPKVYPLLPDTVSYRHRDRACPDRAEQDRTSQERAGQDRALQDRTGQDRTGQDRTDRPQNRVFA